MSNIGKYYKFAILISFIFNRFANNNYTCSNLKQTIVDVDHGFISDGPGEYSTDVHCEWLIIAPNNSFVTLNVITLQTECLYDFLYVYDGDSYVTGRLMASVCGNQTFQNFTTSSSKMLIMLFSDKQSVQKGFEAEFFVFSCPENCNNRGSCSKTFNTCTCDDHYTGRRCERETCRSNQCNGRGNCISQNETYVCQCRNGYSGDFCNLPTQSNASIEAFWFEWNYLSNTRFLARSGHNMVYVNDVGKLFVFNGHDLNKVLDDVVEFDVLANNWTVLTGRNPYPRYGASADDVPFGFVYYGGWSSYGNFSVSNQIVVYSTVFSKWSQPIPECPNSQCSNPPGLVYHTLTSVDDSILYVVGGITESFSFNEMIYKYDILQNVWTKFVPRNYIGVDTRRFGHSTVYDKTVNCLVIFGGMVPQSIRLSNVDDSVIMFDINRQIWIKLKQSSGLSWPAGRAFHSASIHDENVLVFGGTTGSKMWTKNENCITDSVWMYDTCGHAWTSLNLSQFRLENTLSRFAHSSAIIGERLVISGGYNGRLFEDVWFFKIPSAETEFNVLCMNQSRSQCSINRHCSWCEDSGVCTSITTTCLKPVNKQTINCRQQFCSSFKLCDECQSASDATCFWCAATKRCLSSANVYDCSSGINKTCASVDRNGIMVVYYSSSPIDLTYPNKVAIADDLNVTFQFSFTDERLLSLGGMYTVNVFFIFTPSKLTAFKTTAVNNLTISAWKVASLSIRMGLNPLTTENNLVFTMNNATNELQTFFVTNVNNKPSDRYYVKIEASQKISVTTGWMSGFILKLNDQIVSGDAVEPYSIKNGCSMSNNCQSCLTNVQCVWDVDKRTCLIRSNDRNSSEPQRLVLSPEFCNQCSHYINCSSCIQAGCSWYLPEYICIRPVTALDVVVNDLGHCPNSCFSRTTCTSCLGTADDCAWCKTSGTCFPFHLYQALFPFGKCQDWVNSLPYNGKDANVTQRCSECSERESCGDCIQSFQCGTCYTNDNKGAAVCLKGDFGFNKCDNKVWNYTSCQGLNQCAIQPSPCHSKAYCNNTDLGYKCQCKPGYRGDGVDRCDKTCDPICVHGLCSGYPGYSCRCDLGWTGDDCSTDCLCNSHSSCKTGVGHCDRCYNNTNGPNCNSCAPGSFGNASLSTGCQLCNCNGHGNVSLGFCHPLSGQCFCTNDTDGDQCQFCRHNYFGDAKDGGICNADCSGRTLITNIQQTGGIGVSLMARHVENIFCVWILTTSAEIPSDPSSNSSPDVHLVVDSNTIKCSVDSLSIYDGIPNFINPDSSTNNNDRLLGNLCSFGQNRNGATYVAPSGIMTVVYIGGTSNVNVKFNARYSPISCPYYCSGRRTCNKDSCQCKSGLFGLYCEFGCRNNCLAECNGDQTANCDCIEDVRCEKNFRQSVPKVEFRESTLSFISTSTTKLLMPSMAYDNKSNVLYVYGGFNPKLNTVVNAFVAINVADGSVTEIGKNSTPSVAYMHSMTVDYKRNGFYLYNGYGSADGGFYFFSYATSQWTQLTTVVQSKQNVPALLGHTLTKTWSFLVLIGGYSFDAGFNYFMYSYTIDSYTWRRHKPSGLNLPAMYGHTAIYVLSLDSIFVYGGYVFDGSGMSLSNRLYVYNVIQQSWYLVPSRKSNPLFTQPLAVSFCFGALVNDYLVFVSRSDNVHSMALPQIQLYNIKDNLWNRVRLRKSNYTSIVSDNSYSFNWRAATPLNDNQLVLLDTISWKLRALSFPDDFCSLSDTNCSFQNCATCSLGDNVDTCLNPKLQTTSSCVTMTGQTAQSNLESEIDCSLLKTCSECLNMVGNELKCQWCSDQCTGGICVQLSKDCDVERCSLGNVTLLSKAEMCPENVCFRDNCASCVNVADGSDYNCAFTKHISRSNTFSFYYSPQPIFPWACARYYPKFMSSSNSTITSINKCPHPCSTYKSGDECVKTNNDHSRIEECAWVGNFNQCISSFALPLLCHSDYCGKISLRQYGEKCADAKSCKNCSQLANCIWCSVPDSNGDGYCTSSSSNVERSAICNGGGDKSSSKNSYQFFPYRCPAENECLNGRHDCDTEIEVCVDSLNGYDCVCKQGYERKSLKCVPVCKNGCNHGTCIKPDICHCDFGYTGPVCNLACNCNGYSDCPGPQDLNTCLKCYNFTTGHSCELCQTGYIMFAKKCLTCQAYCNYHSFTCTNGTGRVPIFSQVTTTTYDRQDIATQSFSPSNVLCQNCADKTIGERCQFCLPGYFRPPNSPMSNPCRLCQCNSHGVNNSCSSMDGTNCICQNNTKTPDQCTLFDDCWRNQCSACKEYFRGKPVDGHQCYRDVADGSEDYCFTTGDSGHCLQSENMYLEYFETAFYVLFPDFSNVDMRINIDVTSGSADIFMATDDVFLVNKTEFGTNKLLLSQEKLGPNADALKKLQDNLYSELMFNWRSVISMHFCTMLNSFIFYTSSQPVLWLRNVTSRATIIVPVGEFDFQKTQFYLVVQSKSAKTMGNLIYVQDQARFELFVFLTVFCSCFVLFIAVFVLVWHLKLSRGQRRVRHNQTLEIALLANRPLARFPVLFEYKGDDYVADCECKPCCLQYVRNGKSSVGTVVVRLPGGRQAPVQLCLATALLTEECGETLNEFDAVSASSSREVKPPNTIFSRISRNRVHPLNAPRQNN